MIDWHRDPRRTERGIQALLRRCYPGLRSLDGSGGDGGRDAQLITADGRTIFEIKSFDRLNNSRRRQVQRSLENAVASASNMTKWVLVVPMNMTPTRADSRTGEEAWFEDILPKYAGGAKLEWWGLDWLDGQVAGDLAVQRYIEGPDSQVLQRAQEFGMERAVLANGANDLNARLVGLNRLADEVSPFWRLDFAVRNGVPETTLRAKVPDAHILDPITITPTFTFRTDRPDDEELRRRLYETFAFGGTVELPPGYVTKFDIEASEETKLLFPKGDPSGSSFRFYGKRTKLERPIRCAYRVLAEDDTVLSSFEVYLRERTLGRKGSMLFGGDPAGVISIEVGLPYPDSRLASGESAEMDGARLRLELTDGIEGYEIASLAPIVRTLAQAGPKTRIEFFIPGFGLVSGGVLESNAFPNAPSVWQFISDLQRMEIYSGRSLSFPRGVTSQDVRDLRNFVLTLDGESAEYPDDLFLKVRRERAPQSLEAIQGDGGLLAASDAFLLEVGDLTLDYGAAAIWAPRPVIGNLGEVFAFVRGKGAPDDEVELRLEAGDLPFIWVPRARAEEYLQSMGKARHRLIGPSPRDP